MSDRRSFSEIPQDLLRDHGEGARVDRVWSRLAKDVEGTRARPRRFEAHRGTLAFAAVTFALGVFIGTHWAARPEAPIASLAPEPALPRPQEGSAPRAEVAQPLPGAAPEAARPSRHSPPAHRASAVSSSSEPAAPAEPESEPAPPVAVAEWPRLAEEGQYQKALASLEVSGGFDAALEGANADQLMSLVDIARATGQRDRAVSALRRVVNEHASDPSASVAAWMLANELAKSHDLAGAEQAFATYRALSPNGDFAEDALARQVDMAAEQGSLERAKKLAGQYLKEFPDGPRSADIQAQLERWLRAAVPETEPAPVPPASVAADAGAPR
jgi:TolA-binding protein